MEGREAFVLDSAPKTSNALSLPGLGIVRLRSSAWRQGLERRLRGFFLASRRLCLVAILIEELADPSRRASWPSAGGSPAPFTGWAGDALGEVPQRGSFRRYK